MNILAWNVRGLVAPPAQHEFLRTLRSSKSTIDFAIDTKLNSEQLQKFQFKLPDKCLISNIHTSRPWARIIALWDLLEVTLQNWYAHPYWIVSQFYNISSGQSFVVIGVYLHIDFRIRKGLFPTLLATLNLCSAPIIRMGDFNAVLNTHKKTGRAPALQACLALSDFVSQSALTEVSCPDAKFTWTNNRMGHENVMSKIDRCYVSKEWVDDLDLLVLLEVLPRTTSDHNPILLLISKRRFRTWGRTPFRHFQYWQDMAGYRDQVVSAWTADTRACTDYFAGLLGTSDGVGNLPSSLASGPTVSPEENADLLKPITATEIQWAETIAGAIRGFFDFGKLVKSINKTHIILLPKEQDDIIFFIDGKLQNLRHLKGCLDEFSSCSGLVMNIGKSSVLSFNMNCQVLSQIESEMGWRQGQLPTTYLGIPLQKTDLTEAQRKPLILRSTQKLAVWKQKCLSPTGRLSLIKHVLSLVPSYWSLVVEIPASTCKQLNKMAVDFLWGDMADCKSFHRIKWSTLCLPKLEGGVGLRDIKETNMANMALLVYRVSQQASPWSFLVKGRYCERKGLLDNNSRGKRVSTAWRRALQSWSKIKEHVTWKIGNGSLVNLTCSVKEIIEVNGEFIMDFLASLNIPFTCPRNAAEQPDAVEDDFKGLHGWSIQAVLLVFQRMGLCKSKVEPSLPVFQKNEVLF
ncbi:putative ribonuclease H protein [Nymphaea thermarum]|nr:putative ribonuclease H protein [Nymphaea thermarum]